MKVLKQFKGTTSSLIVTSLISCLSISSMAQTRVSTELSIKNPAALKATADKAKDLKALTSMDATQSSMPQKAQGIGHQPTTLKQNEKPTLKKDADGTNSSGGGNEKEADFIFSARLIFSQLNQDKVVADQILGMDINDYLTAIEKTEVHCAVGDVLQIMRDFRKTGYYLATTGSIHLDCDNYYEAKLSSELGYMTIFHEYMRAAGLEGSTYGISSKLGAAFIKLGLPAWDGIDHGIRKCYDGYVNFNYSSMSLISFDFDALIGRQVAKCLIEEGFKKKRDKNLSIEQVFTAIGRGSIRAKDLKSFSTLVNAILMR